MEYQPCRPSRLSCVITKQPSFFGPPDESKAKRGLISSRGEPVVQPAAIPWRIAVAGVGCALAMLTHYPLGIAAGWLCYLGYHAVHEEWKRCGARPAFVAALAGLAGAAVIQRGAEALFR